MLEYLRKTRFAEGDRASAEAQARSIAHYLKEEYGASRVVGIGSLFSSHKVFRPDSDIDLIAEGIPPYAFFRASARWLIRIHANSIPINRRPRKMKDYTSRGDVGERALPQTGTIHLCLRLRPGTTKNVPSKASTRLRLCSPRLL